jgi:hypothetical protein
MTDPITLPANYGSERTTAILDAVANGQAHIAWANVDSSYEEHEATFLVFADALKLNIVDPSTGEAKLVRINVSATSEQKIADMLDCMLLTPKLADLIWVNRKYTIGPSPQSITSSTQAMVDHSGRVDAALAKVCPTWDGGLVCTQGKHWCIDEALAGQNYKALNYGWHFDDSDGDGKYQGIYGEVNASLFKSPNGTYVRVIQGRGTAHDPEHEDYSQVCVLVHTVCKVDGKYMLLEDVLTNAELAPLASHQGTMTVMRQPGVEQVSTKADYIDMFPITVIERPSIEVLKRLNA